MTIKLTKQKFMNHLEYNWIKYIAILLGAIVFWWLIYTMTSNVQRSNKIDIILIDGTTVNEQITGRITNDKKAIFGEQTDIKQINFGNFYSTKNSNLESTYPLQAEINDMLIAPTEFYDDPYHLRFVYDFDTIMSPFSPKDSKGKPITDLNGGEFTSTSYWKDALTENGFLTNLRKMNGGVETDKDGALYVFHWDEASQRKKLTDKLRAEIKEELNDTDKKKIEDELIVMKKAVDDMGLEGKILGIILNKIPGLEKSCFFKYAEKNILDANGQIEKDESGKEKTITSTYILSVLGKNTKTCGDNIGYFNKNKKFFGNDEVFKFIGHMFSRDKVYSDKLNINRYAAL